MSLKRQLLKILNITSVLGLAALLMVACSGSEIAAQVNDGKITICHATGDSTNPYDQITIDFDELNGHSNHKNDLILASIDGCPNVVETDGNDGKITICHATASATNPYNKITIDFNGLRGHSNHKGDIIPAPESGCPLVTPTPAITATPTLTPTATAFGDNDTKITICHATGSSKNPFVMITISVNGLNGHDKHAGDIIPAPAGGCPK